jgi:3-hydroxybutyryl-CoA dehydrogenase
VGVVGLGLMGTSITACLLAAGHPVAAVTRSASKRRTVRARLKKYLADLKREGLVDSAPGTVESVPEGAFEDAREPCRGQFLE